jgi:hypothetical protein
MVSARPRHGAGLPSFDQNSGAKSAENARVKPSKMLAVNCETHKKALRNSRNLATPRIRLQKDCIWQEFA